ncbi:type III secretion system export apparatus subunit SctT [Pseudoduganella sp. R-32]|uniref:type III secretion system export apparatus subunit SctT n=1 Tax=Pseudoduganella sp. R-32 TaxID=3404061 RepID=UPI003CEC0368
MAAAPLPNFLLPVSCLALAMPRMLGCALVLPALGRQHMAGLERSAFCLALSLPQAQLLWPLLQHQPLTFLQGGALALKEVLLGVLLGCLLAVPFWAMRAAGTLIDNQRGTNAAQQINPSLQADSSILGELCERALLVYLIETGLFLRLFDVMADSYQLWPALTLAPLHAPAAHQAMLAALTRLMADAMLYSAPVLLVTMLAEYVLAIGSSVLQGLDVYQVAMPVKAMLALWMLMMCFPALLPFIATHAGEWWGDAVLQALCP